MGRTDTEMNQFGRERLMGMTGRAFEMLMEAWAVDGEGRRGRGSAQWAVRGGLGIFQLF